MNGPETVCLRAVRVSGCDKGGAVSQIVGDIHEAARRQQFKISLTMYAVVAVGP